ncbi:MAG: hypothetical protein WBW04_17490 [Nitrolancea sp.]
MSTQESTAVHIASSEDVVSLLERLPHMKDDRVLVTVSDECDELLTAAEFHRVLNAARAHNVTLAISTGDSLRQELARMLGWVVIDTDIGSGSRGNTENLPSRGGDTENIDGAWTQLHTTADLATYRPKTSPLSNTNGNGQTKSIDGTVIADAETTAKVAEQQAAPVAPPQARVQTLNEEDYDEPQPDTVRQRRRFPRPTRRAFMLVGAIGAPLVVLIIVAGLLMYILPTATVTVVPVEKSISADLVYGLASPGKNYDVTIQPEPVTHTSTFDKKIPTTGERFEPDGTAGGEVLLTNSLLQAVTVPSGTALAGKNGINYITQKDVTIAAADPYGSLSFGSATVPVAAASAGDSGNTDAGTVVGQLDSGVFFNNRDAIAGGTMKRIAVVSQDDIDALKAAAEADLAGKVDQEFQGVIPDGTQMVPDSESKSDPTLQYSMAAGQDGTEVSVHATETITGEVFDPGQLNALAKDEAARQLAAKVGSDEIILSDTVTIGDPVSLPGGVSFSRQATARTRAVISADEQRALEKQIVGKSQAEARSILQSMSDVASFNIVIEPSWLPQHIPQLNSHIKIVVSNANESSSSP